MVNHLESGGRLVLFAEGRITRTGSLMKIFDGTGFLINKTGAKVITCYLRGANRLKLSKQPGWRKWFPRISVHFSEAETAPQLENLSAFEVRERMGLWLRDRMMLQQFETEFALQPKNLVGAIARAAAETPDKEVLEDISFKPLTYRRLMLGTDVLSEALDETLGLSCSARVGVVLPNANAIVLTLMSLWSLGRVPAILNFTTGIAIMKACAKLAEISHVVTSRQFLEKAKLDLSPLEAEGIKLVYLEDVREGISTSSKLKAFARRRIFPGAVRCPDSLGHDDTATIIFTSGSEGVPKAVELTHGNFIANILQVLITVDVMDSDRIFNALPIFHSLGLMGGTLLPLMRGIYTFLYPTPLHYRVIPTLTYDRNCTILFGTNTFLNGYARKAHPYDFSSVRYVVAGAEKVQEATFNTWSRKFGLRIMEGYGATECSPVISLNAPMDFKFGCAGRFLPGIEYKLEPVEGVEDGGRLLVRGPNMMKGYLNPDANAQFKACDGWYDTGDIVRVDASGCLFIQGRMKRFAKVSGEMVSLTAIEDALAGAFPIYGLRCQIAVVARPDQDKGERLIAVTNESRLTLADIRTAVRDKGLSNLCAPRELRIVPSVPKLGTGKVNYRELDKMLAE
jgi:acyl-[acyl-carrier-protein]-phospholipid O-acyltransferase/long-chain-fatty-acid--[acyl-carrier-protein] ligase